MLYLLVEGFREWLEAHGLGFLRVFTFAEFQTTAAILVSFLFCILLGPRVIAWLRKQKIGDHPNFDQAEIDKLMASKKGTPTMGGLLIIVSIVFSTLLLANLRNFYVEMALVCVLWLGAVGATDDWLKLTAARRAGSRQGLTSLEKLLFQIGLGVVLAYFTFNYDRFTTHTLYFPFLKSAGLRLNLGVYHPDRHRRHDRLQQRRQSHRRPRWPRRRLHGHRQLHFLHPRPDRRHAQSWPPGC